MPTLEEHVLISGTARISSRLPVKPATNGGNYFAFDRPRLRLIHRWRPG